MNEVLERLLQAQVRYELAKLEGQELARTIEHGVARLFAWSRTVALQDVVTPEQIHGVIERYVVELRVSGGITELTGELARLVLQSRRSASTRVDEIVTPASYAEFADKLVGLDALRRVLIQKLAQSMTFSAINAQLIARGSLDLLTPSVVRQAFGAASKLWEPLSRSLHPLIERRLADLLEQFLERHRERVTRDVEQRLLKVLEPESMRVLLDEIWDGVAAMPLSEAFASIGEQDLEDFVVLVHEFWLRYRKSDFFREISKEMVDYFFAKYGAQTLAAIVDDMGVSEAMVSAELIYFLQPILQHAARSGALEQTLRETLSSFYSSDAALRALQG